MAVTPEQLAREKVDAALHASGWLVQNRDELDLGAGPGIAVREFPMKHGFGAADYLLYLNCRAVGAIEAKADGTLTGVEAQSAKYAAGLPENLPAYHRPLPFLFESNGSVTYFTNGLDPKPRSRQVFAFPRPETCVDWLEQSAQLRGRLQNLPALDDAGLWKVQGQAIRNLEASFAQADPRALIQMATGSGKTFTAVNIAYRLLKYGGAKRILFLVDRANLAKQTEDEFADFTPPDDTRKFPTLYTVQRLRSNHINPAAKVVITTIQRLYSMLKGEVAYDEGNEEGSAFDSAKPWKGEPPDVVYNAGIPPEFFDFVIVDECHRSIYDLWAQVLLYFDAFLIGLTATPAGKTIGFFKQNLVMQYGHDEAVIDNVNVDFDVYRIRTRITEDGATIVVPDATGIYVDKRHKYTRAERLERLNQDLTYTANELDRDVVSESQLRTVIQQFRDKVLPEAFPGRIDKDGNREVPKTLVFAKDDSHADDIVRMFREVFAEENRFCEKITYRTGFTRVVTKVKNKDGSESEVSEWIRTNTLTPDDILINFRNSYFPRIAVTVDMISTGTDVKPIECVFFLRNVKSAGYFEQMKGRGVRVISPDKLKVVTPTAESKERFVIVDAVGVCEQDKTDSHTLNRQPSKTLAQVLEYIAQGGTDPDALTTLAGRLARLQCEFSAEQLGELRELAGGRSLGALGGALLHACDADAQIDAAKATFAVEKPSEEQVAKATEQLAQQATKPFLNPALRRRILEMRAQNEQTIDRHSIDDVLYAGFDAAAVDKAHAKVKDFRAWIATHKDQLAALQAIYAGTRPLKITLKDLRQLRDALRAPPLAASPTQLWRAFELVEQVSDAPPGPKVQGEQLADLVNLVRHGIEAKFPLQPFADDVRRNYRAWLTLQEQAGVEFSAEQREWLDRIAEHIATSLEIEPEDFQDGWFGQHGGHGKVYQLFGDSLKPMLAELNERLAA